MLLGGAAVTPLNNYTFRPSNATPQQGVHAQHHDEIAGSLAGTYPVLNFGAVGDNVADDTAAIQAAIDACAAAGGGIVWIPRGTYKVTSTLTVTSSSVTLTGAGMTGPPGSGLPTPPWAPATVLQWAGGASPVVKWTYVSGCHASGFGVDGGGTASHGLRLEGFIHGSLARIAVKNTVANTGIAVYMSHGTKAGQDMNTQWNSFSDLHLDAATCLYLTGNRPTLTHDVTGCVFTNLSCMHASTTVAPGIVLDYCDGNTFRETWTFCKDFSNGGLSVDIKDQAVHNFFFHLGLSGNSGGGLRARTPASPAYTNTALFINGPQEGAPPAPIVDAGATFNYWSYTNKDNDILRAPRLDLRAQTRRELQNVKGEAFQRILGTGATSPVGGSVYMTGIALLANDTITNILCSIEAGGVGTNLSKLGLYDSTFNLVAVSADQGTSWNTAGLKVVPLLTPYTVVNTGFYYLAVIAKATTTVPALWRCGAGSGVAPQPFSGGTGNLWLFDGTTGRTDFPASFTPIGGGGVAFWLGWS